MLTLLGRALALTPEPALRAACGVIGALAAALSPKRRRIVHSNLHHAFPDRPRAWRRRLAREVWRRVVETFMLSLAAPFLSEKRIREIGSLGPSAEALARDLSERPRPMVLATFHLCLWESQSWFKLLSPFPLPEFGIIFRPLDNAAADAFVKRTREQHGMKLLSRKEGFAQALAILRGKGVVGILVDQNAGMQGALSLLFGRVASTTELPGILAAKFKAEVRTFYPRRTAFWRVQFESAPIPSDGTADSVTLALNRWLEQTLSADEALCASWLWSHERWRTQDVAARRLRLEAKRSLLDLDLAARSLPALPRGTRLWIRMPNWLGDVVMALPLIRAVRASRPDLQITLVTKKGFVDFLESTGVADRVVALPPKGWAYFLRCWSFREQYPDFWILLTHSFRGDLEAWLSGARQRFGIIRKGRSRPLLTHRFEAPAGFDEAKVHQMELWTQFLGAFGLQAPADTTPLLPPAYGDGPIGLIAGSENTPSKRWPVDHWRSLIEALPAQRFVLFGTPGDAAITRAISAGMPADRVEDLAGRTTLTQYRERLRGCRLIVSNDTGGMHLANALGLPVIGLFGPTNPVRTGPVFGAPRTLLQPPGCPPTGGGSLADLEVRTVVLAVERALGIAKTTK